MNLFDEMDVSPRQRITVPEGHVAVILRDDVASEVKSMCISLRKHRRISSEDKNAIQAICGDLLLAIVEAS